MAFDQDSWNDGFIMGSMAGITAYGSGGTTEVEVGIQTINMFLMESASLTTIEFTS